MSFIYAIHDAYYPGCNDGDVDDRATIQLYDKYLSFHPEVSYIVVYLVGEGRYEKAKAYMSEQTNEGSRIIYDDKFNLDEAKTAEKIIICAPISDENIRIELAKIITEKHNGYCQGDKIGVTNFPKPEYQQLLDSIPVKHRFTTQSTAISFPSTFLDAIDSKNKDEYMSYGLIKLFAIGGIIHIPSLIYRLYCPKIGGGPGTNMIKIQELIQKYLIIGMENTDTDTKDYDQTKVKQLKDIIVCEDNFQEFNSQLIDIIYHKEIYLQANMNLVNEFMDTFREKMPNANHEAMENALRVMIYFARMCYVTEDADLLFSLSSKKFYSLSEIPQGKSTFEMDETPPLYDFVVAWFILNGYTNQSYFLDDKELTKKKILDSFD